MTLELCDANKYLIPLSLVANVAIFASGISSMALGHREDNRASVPEILVASAARFAAGIF